MSASNIHIEKFNQLLEQVRIHVQTLKKQNRELSKENQKLEIKLRELEDGQSNIFSAFNETERIAMKNQIEGLIEKIDKHLEE